MRKVILNLEETYRKDIASGLGFDIDRPITVAKKEPLRDPRGIYSSLFGGDISDTTELQRRWSCKCGKIVGKFRSNVVCPDCGCKPVLQDNELEKTGYISLNEPFVVINADMYPFIKKVCKASRLDEILKADKTLDKHGKMKKADATSKNPFANIGMIEFKNRFDEILAYFAGPKNVEEYNFIMENKDKVFTSKIPVLTMLLRPVVMIGDTFNYDSINTLYQTLVSDAYYLNNNEYEKETRINLQILYNIQMTFNKIKDKIEREKINGKTKFVRSSIFGIRINFSARHVIIPNAMRPSMEGIAVPYITFCEFYKYHIMNIYRKMYRVTVNELNQRWHTLVYKQDPSLRHIINMLIKNTEGGLVDYVNRNPTLRIGSSQAHDIVSVHTDINNLTMMIPPNCTGAKNADFDGDAENTSPIFDYEFGRTYKAHFSPRRLFVNPAKNEVDPAYILKQDQLLACWSFFNDDLDEEDYEYDENDDFTIVTRKDLKEAQAYYKNGGIAPCTTPMTA